MGLLLTIIVILLGSVTLLAAQLLKVHLGASIWVSILETFGVTLFTVFSVKLVYEKLIAGEHIKAFGALVRKEFGHFKDAAVSYETLGIREAFSSRSAFLARHSLGNIVASRARISTLTIVGTNLFHIMNQRDYLLQAVGRGIALQLCILDPRLHSPAMEQLTGLEKDSCNASVRKMQELLRALAEKKPPGSLEIRAHKFFLFDSLIFSVTQDHVNFVALSMSFGPDLKDKREIVLDATKQLGQDLVGRYGKLWTSAEKVVEFKEGELMLDKLADLLPAGQA